MKTLPIELTREFTRRFYSVRHLIIFEFDSKNFLWTDADTDIYWATYWFTSKAIEFDAVKYAALPNVDSLSFTIDNAGKEFSDIVLGEDTRGRECTVYAVALDLNNTVIQETLVFYGYCDRMTLNQEVASVEIANHMIKWKTLVPKRTYAPYCLWQFQDDGTCTYVPTAEVSTTVKVQWNAAATQGDVTATAGMSSTTDNKISIVLDDGSIHWSQIDSVDDGDTITIVDAIPAGRHADVGAAVTTYAWCDHSPERCAEMSNSVNFGGFKWCPWLQDKQIWWGRAQGGNP